MDGGQFDRITQLFAREQSRRSALKKAIALIGGGGALAAHRTTEAARRGYSGPMNQCQPSEIRCDGACYPASTTECCNGVVCPLGQCAPSGECCTGSAVICGDSCCLGPCLADQCCSPDVGYPCSPGDGSTYCAPNGSCCTDGDCPVSTDPCLLAVCSVGTCSTTPAPEGTLCDDLDLCTGSGSCSTGVCQPGASLGCPAPGDCQLAGTCDPSTGLCNYPAAADGSSCGSGQQCCGGVCCPAQSSCDGGTCASSCAALGASCEDDSGCCQDKGVTRCEDVCCLANYETATGPGDCCSGLWNGDFCCAGPNSPCSDDGECCNSELGICDDGVCWCRKQGESCGSSSECCGFDICQSGVCVAGTCNEPGETCHDDNECCQDGGAAYCHQPDFRCCRVTGGTCNGIASCCGDDICSSSYTCCRPPGIACTVDGECCTGYSCIDNICREACPSGEFPCGVSDCCTSAEHCVDGGCMCLPLRSHCDPDNNLCCQDEETMCYPYGVIDTAPERCCRGLGGSCDPNHDLPGNLPGDCCSLSGEGSRGACGWNGICGGTGAVCFSNEECISGDCRGHCGNQFPLKYCLEHSECDCEGDISDGCVQQDGFCIQLYCR